MTTSFLDYFISPQSTPLPTLRVNSRLYQLQTESKLFFTIDEHAEAADGNNLAVTIGQHNQFSLNYQSHSSFVTNCTNLFREKSIVLQAIDTKIMAAALVAIAAMSIPFIPFAGWIAMAAWMTALYLMHERGNAYAEYHESLVLLAATCNWSLGEVNHQPNKKMLADSEIIQNMMKQLYSVLTETQTKHLIDDAIESQFVAALKASDDSNAANTDKKYGQFFSSPALKEVVLKKQGPEFFRCMYGLNKGKPKDFLDAFLTALPDLWRAAKNIVEDCRTPSPSV